MLKKTNFIDFCFFFDEQGFLRPLPGQEVARERDVYQAPLPCERLEPCSPSWKD
jgi:hypothetical protein